MVGYVLIVVLTCLTTAVIALFCSVFFKRTTISLMTSYLVIGAQFAVPPAARIFADTFFPQSATASVMHASGVLSPISAVFSLPLNLSADNVSAGPAAGGGSMFFGFIVVVVVETLALVGAMIWLFNRRWRVSA